jgi:signal-transduction protein with cAMP-binding, CBS, and nucleotidyltransferase domain
MLALSLEEALRTHRLKIDLAATCSPDATIGDAIAKSGGKPILVTSEKANDLIGIITPFDMLKDRHEITSCRPKALREL